MKRAENLKNDYLSRYEFVIALPDYMSEMREKSGMSDSQFCKKYDFDKSYLCRLLGGGFCPRASTIRKLKRALKKEGII